MPRIQGTRSAPIDTSKKERKLVPEGIYLCRLASVKGGKPTKNGDQTWNLGFIILEGPHEGEWLNDRLIFSEKAYFRMVKFLGVAGIKVPEGDFDLKKDHIRGRIVYTETEHKSYRNRETGEKIVYNGVPYDGYFRASREEVQEYQRGPIPTPLDDLPGDEGAM